MKDFKLTFTSLSEAKKKLNELFIGNPSAAFRLSAVEWKKKRSLPANAVYNTWIAPISDFMALTIPEATRYIKLEFGLPILFANEDYGPVIGEGLNAKGFFNLTYEDKLLAMEKLPVTRLFDTKMHNQLRDNLQAHFGNMGLNLEYK